VNNILWENVFKRNNKSRTIQKALSDNILFRNLTRTELVFIEQIIHERQYRAGEAIFNQGDVGVGMYIILKGSVDIAVVDVDLAKPEHHKEVFVTRLEKDDFFGELSLVEETGIRSATARAAEETTLLGFFKPDLIELLERNPSTGVKVVFRLAEVLGQRLKDTTEKITKLKSELRLIHGLEERNKANEGKSNSP
jgi:CRP/FNR family cyclic AMP-dependent transcriptional regulator